jgi:hypothetical protein
MQLDRFQPGLVYDVGTVLGTVLLAEHWAEPVDDDDSAFVTPATTIRGFTDRESDHKALRAWSRRWSRKDVALTADRPRRPAQKRRRTGKR